MICIEKGKLGPQPSANEDPLLKRVKCKLIDLPAKRGVGHLIDSVAEVQFSPVLPPFFENRELNQ